MWDTISLVINSILVCLYGSLLSAYLCGGFRNRKEKIAMLLVDFMALLLQLACYNLFGEDLTYKLYPLITHLPFVLFLVFYQRRAWGLSTVAVLTSYYWCQVPRFIGKLAEWTFDSETAYRIVYPFALIGVYLLLRLFFCKTASAVMQYSSRSLVIFGCVPAFYYAYDYITTIYYPLEIDLKSWNEFIPVALAVFYLAVISLYHEELQRRSAAELQNMIMEMSIKQSEAEINTLLRMQEESAIYRHDMRHLVRMLTTFLSDGDIDGALAYIGKADEKLQSITPHRYCENNSLNVLFRAFEAKAHDCGIILTINTNVSKDLAIPEMEFCTLLSNALENAIIATQTVASSKQIDVSCSVKQDKLLLSVANPYSGNVAIENGLPVSNRPGHGFGVKSIQSIVLQHNGICTFQAQNGNFVLHVILPNEASA